jgi:hypothetical protein
MTWALLLSEHMREPVAICIRTEIDGEFIH